MLEVNITVALSLLSLSPLLLCVLIYLSRSFLASFIILSLSLLSGDHKYLFGSNSDQPSNLHDTNVQFQKTVEYTMST